MTPSERAAAVRRTAGLFPLPGRGLLQVEGADRVRWLEGMLSNRVGDLVPGPEHSGCYALLLSPIGRILADLHVLVRKDAFWLELESEAMESVRPRLERSIVADDVSLVDASAAWARFALEGDLAPEILEAACGAPSTLAPDAGVDVALGGVPAVVAAFGWSGSPGLQLFLPAARAAAALDALRAAAGERLLDADAATLEVLRIEAGIPRFGPELGEEVLPAEAGLVTRAVSLTKGCFTGQEIVARLESRGQVGHRLVGLCFAAGSPAPPGTPLDDEGGKRVGEVTSACVSTRAGAIGLGFVRRPLDAVGTRLLAGDLEVRVAGLPLVPLSPPDPA